MAVGKVNVGGKYNINSYIAPEDLGLGKYIKMKTYLSICLDADGNYAVITSDGTKIKRFDKEGNEIANYTISLDKLSMGGYQPVLSRDKVELLFVGDTNAIIFAETGNPGYVPYTGIFNYNLVNNTCTSLEYHPSTNDYGYAFTSARLSEDKFIIAANFNNTEISSNIYYISRSGIVYKTTISSGTNPSLSIIPNSINNFVEINCHSFYSDGGYTDKLIRINLSNGNVIRTISNYNREICYIMDDYKGYEFVHNSTKLNILDLNNNFEVISSIDFCTGKTMLIAFYNKLRTITIKFSDNILNIYNQKLELIKNLDAAFLDSLYGGAFFVNVACTDNDYIFTDGSSFYTDKLKILK